MSRFANPTATGRFVLPGGCQCVGSPHEEDWMDLRTQLGTSDIIALEGVDTVGQVAHLLTGWNLLDDDGTEAPLDHEHIGRLFAESVAPLREWIAENVSALPLPNVSGAHSANGSRASASPTPRTRKRH